MMLGPVASSEEKGSMFEPFLVGQEQVGMLWPARDPPLPLTSHLDLCLWINFSQPQFSHLEYGTNDNAGLRTALRAAFCLVRAWLEGPHLRGALERKGWIPVFTELSAFAPPRLPSGVQGRVYLHVMDSFAWGLKTEVSTWSVQGSACFASLAAPASP